MPTCLRVPTLRAREVARLSACFRTCSAFAVPYDCNCADCNCETCYSCSCTAAVFSCDHTSCGTSGCWCSPLCKCCHIASCEYPCNCKSCCETCHRQECKRSVTYSTTAVRPASAEAGSAGDFTVAGFEFADTNNVTCVWRQAGGAANAGETAVAGSFLSPGALQCPPPALGSLPPFVGGVVRLQVAVSLAGGAPGTLAGFDEATAVTLFRCGEAGAPGVGWAGEGLAMEGVEAEGFHLEGLHLDGLHLEGLAAAVGSGSDGCGEHGQCRLSGSGEDASARCVCSAGWGGAACGVQCPADATGAPCSGHGECDASSGACRCGDGWDGPDCSQEVDNCPAGRFVPLALSGLAARAGGEEDCTGACPGSSGCVEPAGACAVVCSGRGDCGSAGGCLCNASLGHYGPACAAPCPTSAGPVALPCGGPDAGLCSSDGSCQCAEGLAGPACSLECPRASEPVLLKQPVGGIRASAAAAAAAAVAPPLSSTSRALRAGGSLTGSALFLADEVAPQDAVASLPVCAGAGSCEPLDATCRCNKGLAGAACNVTCPGVSGCAPDPAGGGITCAVECSGHGVCDSVTGGCGCAAGWWGAACEHACDCDHGICDGTTGDCACLSGWAGPACDQACPRGADGAVCSGVGRCLESAAGGPTARCECSSGRNGSACGEVTCAMDCFGRGRCMEGGSCQCDEGWQPPTCAVPVPRSAGGVIQWREAPGGMARDAGTLQLVLVRDGSSLGEATATWRCIDGSAKQGKDFECGGGGAQAVSWPDGDSSPKQVSVELLAAPGDGTGQDPGEVAFDVVIGSVAPTGVSMGSRANVTVLLWPPSMDRLARENVRVTFRLLAAYSSVTRDGSDPAAARFREQLLADLAGEEVLRVPASRLLVSSVGSALSGRATVCTLLVLRPAAQAEAVQASPDRSGSAAGVVASAFVELASNTSSAMYAAQRTWSRLTDVSFAPVVEAAEATPSPQPAPGQPEPTPAWAVAVGVVVPVLVAALGCFVGYRNRRAVAEWLLWRAGQLRFASLQDTDHRRQLELELEEFSDAESAGEGIGGAVASPGAVDEGPSDGPPADGSDGKGSAGAAGHADGDTAPLAAAGAGSTQRWGPVVR